MEFGGIRQWLLWLMASAFLFPLSISSCLAGAWTQEENRFLFVGTQSVFVSDGYYDRDGNRQPQQQYRKYEINPYIEWGITDRLTAGANLFLHYVEQDVSETISLSPTTSLTTDTASYNAGLGDAEVFARYRIWRQGDALVSIQPLVKLPSLYLYDRLPRSGGSQWDGELSLLGGYGFELWDRWHYVDTRLGYRHRVGNEIHDQLKADIKLGLRVSANWVIQPAIYTTWATDIPKNTPFTESGENDYDLVKLEASAMYYVTPMFYLQAGLATHAAGRNAGTGASAFFGTGIQW